MTGARVNDDPLELVPFDGPIDAEIRLPGSKSITNRMLLVAALAAGPSEISGVLFAEDTEAMLGAIRALGATVSIDRTAATVAVTPGPPTTSADVVRVDANQSGTTSRFVLPVLAALPGEWILDGDEQLRQRPFDDQIVALRALGAEIAEEGHPNRLPLRISGRRLRGGNVEIPGNASSQFLSGLLLSGPLMESPLEIGLTTELVSRPYVELTKASMAAFGVTVTDTGSGFAVQPGSYESAKVLVEPDASAASYFFGAAALSGGRCRVLGLGSDSLQGDLGFVDVLEAMGATVEQTSEWTEVWGPERLDGVTADMSQLSDTAQTLAAVATGASGRTEATGIGFIQGKEVRRLDAVVAELTRLGLHAELTNDGFVVDGGPVSASAEAPVTVQTYGDHRMAMSFALVGLVNRGVSISDPRCVNKTFPGFWEALESLRPGSLAATTAPLKVVAVDGPAGSGKSTVATALAAELGAVHFDTGAMYRAVAYAVLSQGVDVADTEGVTAVACAASIELGDRVIVNGEDATVAIRHPDVTAIVSATSAIPAVREQMVRLQREWAIQQDGAVLDGRDIGTVVFPDAPAKFYLTARVEVRARRRFEESTGQTIEEITADMERRDAADSSRITSPLRPADDAVMIDTSDRTVADIVTELAQLTRAAWRAGRDESDGVAQLPPEEQS